MKRLIASLLLCSLLLSLTACNMPTEQPTGTSTSAENAPSFAPATEEPEKDNLSPDEESISDTELSALESAPQEEYDERKFFVGERELTALYAVATNDYVMAEIAATYDIEMVLNAYNERSVTEGTANGDGYAYLMFFGDDKEYVYLTENDSAALVKYCTAAIVNSPLHPSWLIHFSPNKLTEALGTTDRAKFTKISDFLKKEVVVQGGANLLNGPVNPFAAMGDFHFRLNFDTGVFYDIVGTDYFDGTGILSVYTSDLDKTTSYTLENGVAEKITKFLSENIAAKTADLQAVLAGGQQFSFVSDDGSISQLGINDVPELFVPDDPYSKIWIYTVIDLDNDASDEALLWVCGTAGDMGGHLVLKCIVDTVYGFRTDYRTFESLKTDGTFSYSNAAGSKEAIASIGFTENKLVINDIIAATGEMFTMNTFTVNGEPSTADEYRKAKESQSFKPDAEWFEWDK